ncbi:MAG: hypothetical protein ACRD98_08320 [Nitrososphaera sp.]
MNKTSDRVEELVNRARTILSSDTEPDRAALWRAYVAIEYAILDLKLRYDLEGQPQPRKIGSKADVKISAALSMLDRIDPSSADKKALLHDMRSCRDLLKALVAIQDRRSITS